MPHEETEVEAQDEIEVEERDVVCIRCGATFATTVTSVMGRKLHGNICGRCSDGEGGRPAEIDVASALSKVGVNVRSHGAATFDGLSGPASEAAREFVFDAHGAGRWARVRGLMLCGTTGVGKTHLAVAVIRALIERDWPVHRIIFDRASRLITEIQDTYGTGGTAKVLEAREKAALWVLDDLGSEKATSDSLRILHDLIDAREGHPNVITSNFTPPQLGDRFNDVDGWARIASRLGSRNYRIVRMAGADQRFTPPAA